MVTFEDVEGALEHAGGGGDDVEISFCRSAARRAGRSFSTSAFTFGIFDVAVGVGRRIAGLALDGEIGRIGSATWPSSTTWVLSERLVLPTKRNRRLRADTGRRPWFSRGRVCIGDVLADDLHAAHLGMQAGNAAIGE